MLLHARHFSFFSSTATNAMDIAILFCKLLRPPDFSACFTHPSCIEITPGLENKIIPCIGVACSAHPLSHQSLAILREHFQRAIPPLVQFNNQVAVRPLCFMPGSDHYCKLTLCLDLSSEPLGRITAQARRITRLPPSKVLGEDDSREYLCGHEQSCRPS